MLNTILSIAFEKFNRNIRDLTLLPTVQLKPHFLAIIREVNRTLCKLCFLYEDDFPVWLIMIKIAM